MGEKSSRLEICRVSANSNQFHNTHWNSRSQVTSDTKSLEVTQTPQGEGSVSEDGYISSVDHESCDHLYKWPMSYKFRGYMTHFHIQ